MWQQEHATTTGHGNLMLFALHMVCNVTYVLAVRQNVSANELVDSLLHQSHRIVFFATC